MAWHTPGQMWQRSAHHFWQTTTLPLLVFLCCGFVTLDVRWPSQATPRVIRMSIITTGMSEAMIARLYDAAAMWTSPAVRFALSVNADTANAGTIAVAAVAPQGRAGHFHLFTDGFISSCHVLIDLTAGPWHTGAEPPPPGSFDMQTSVAHEFGHCLGLGHSDQSVPPALLRTLIHGGEFQRTLSPDDIAGKDALFPLASPAVRRSGCALF